MGCTSRLIRTGARDPTPALAGRKSDRKKFPVESTGPQPGNV